MAPTKKFRIRHANSQREHEVESIDSALKQLAKDVKKGDVTLPVTVEFDTPEGAQFSITVATVDAAEEITTFGFMY